MFCGEKDTEMFLNVIKQEIYFVKGQLWRDLNDCVVEKRSIISNNERNNKYLLLLYEFKINIRFISIFFYKERKTIELHQNVVSYTIKIKRK